MKKYVSILFLGLILILSFHPAAEAQKGTEKSAKQPPKAIAVPNSVLNVTKENTYPNPAQDMPTLQPSELTQQLIDSSKVKIENPDLIRMLNETSVSSTPSHLDTGPSSISVSGRLIMSLLKPPLIGNIRGLTRIISTTAAARPHTRFIMFRNPKRLSAEV
jgi:hypothetical protein